jgi:hypothetical protein
MEVRFFSPSLLLSLMKMTSSILSTRDSISGLQSRNAAQRYPHRLNFSLVMGRLLDLWASVEFFEEESDAC